jgi:predicted MFS family arabinose efflux permease
VVFVCESRPEPSSRRPHRPRIEGLKEAWGHAVISRILAISFIVVIGFAGIEATYGLWTQARFGWGPRQIGLAFMVIGILGAVCQGWLSGRLVRRYGEPRTLTGGLVFMGLGLVVQWLSPVWPVAIAGFALVCIGQSICFPNLTALISRAAPPDRQGEMLGLNMSGMALARIGGPVLAGELFSVVAPGAPFAMAALLVVPGLYFAAQVRRRVQPTA